MTFSAQPARTPGAMLRDFSNRAPGTAGIAALTIAVWCVCAIQAHSITATAGGPVAETFLLWGPYVEAGGVNLVRVLTYLLLHVGIGHLAANMFLLLLVGYEVERWAGTAKFVALYIFGGLTSAGAVLLMDTYAPTVGASGAIYALMPVLVLIAWERRQSLTGPLVLVAVNLGYTLMVPGVSLWGHLGGLTGGALVAAVMWARRRG